MQDVAKARLHLEQHSFTCLDHCLKKKEKMRKDRIPPLPQSPCKRKVTVSLRRTLRGGGFQVSPAAET